MISRRLLSSADRRVMARSPPPHSPALSNLATVVAAAAAAAVSGVKERRSSATARNHVNAGRRSFDKLRLCVDTENASRSLCSDAQRVVGCLPR